MAEGLEHGSIAVNFAILLGTFLKSGRLGRVVGTDSGIWLERDPDTVREPDLAFIVAENLPLGTRVRGYSEVVPDLVVELISPSARPVAVNDKAEM